MGAITRFDSPLTILKSTRPVVYKREQLEMHLLRHLRLDVRRLVLGTSSATSASACKSPVCKKGGCIILLSIRFRCQRREYVLPPYGCFKEPGNSRFPNLVLLKMILIFPAPRRLHLIRA